MAGRGGGAEGRSVGAVRVGLVCGGLGLGRRRRLVLGQSGEEVAAVAAARRRQLVAEFLLAQRALLVARRLFGRRRRHRVRILEVADVPEADDAVVRRRADDATARRNVEPLDGETVVADDAQKAVREQADSGRFPFFKFINWHRVAMQLVTEWLFTNVFLR